MKTAGSLNQGIAQRDSFPRLADFLLGFATERLGPLIPAMEMKPDLAEVILRKGADRVKPAVVDRLFELLGHTTKAHREAAALALGGSAPRSSRARPGCSRTARPTSALPRCSCSRRPARPRRSRRSNAGSTRSPPTTSATPSCWPSMPPRPPAGARLTAEIERRIRRAAPKLQVPAADWLDESRLPALRYRDGAPLNPKATRYLLYRQSRAKEVRPDVEARPLYALIDRTTSGAFALEVFRQFAGSKADAKDRWALAIAGLLGDDRLVPILNQSITTWADSSQANMAQYAVQALALLGTDAALMSLDAAAIRYRTKNKRLRRAAREAFAATAERQGLTVDELGDRSSPGWASSRAARGSSGRRASESRSPSGPDFKLKVSATSRRTRRSPRCPGACRRRRWTSSRRWRRRSARWPRRRSSGWRRSWCGSSAGRWPVGRSYSWAIRFCCCRSRPGWSGATITTAAPCGARFGRWRTGRSPTRPTSPSTCRRPARWGSSTRWSWTTRRSAWRTHLADYEVRSPFPQLERPVVRVSDERRDTKISRGAWRGRAWTQ